MDRPLDFDWGELEEGDRVVVVERPKRQVATCAPRPLNVIEELALADWTKGEAPKLELIFDPNEDEYEEGDRWDFHPSEDELAPRILASLGISQSVDDDDDSGGDLDQAVGEIAFAIDDDFDDPVTLGRLLRLGWDDLPSQLPCSLGSATWSQFMWPETQHYTLVKVPGYDLVTVVATGAQAGPSTVALGPIEPGTMLLEAIRKQILRMWRNVYGTCDEDGGAPSSVTGSEMVPTDVMEKWVAEEWPEEEEED